MVTASYPPIEDLAVVGDRRAAAMLDGAATICFMCFPWYNDEPIFASLLDAERGGSWKVGMTGATGTERSYSPACPVHRLLLTGPAGSLEVLDFMPFPQTDRPEELADVRMLVRLVRCLEGSPELTSSLTFHAPAACSTSGPHSATIRRGGEVLARMRSSAQLDVGEERVDLRQQLQEGQVAWMVLTSGKGEELDPDEERVEQWLAATTGYWEQRAANVQWSGGDRQDIVESASVLHLLTCAPAGATLAAPTTSLPERIGGDRNYDYRYSWIRDASISLAMVSSLGDTGGARSYMDWICRLGSGTDAPLQVVYEFNGGTQIPEREAHGLAGYRGSSPVRFGNRAHAQLQLDSMGFFADCAQIFLASGGEWRGAYWDVVKASADFTAARWRDRDSGIWELPSEQHWTSSKVMSWVVLDRAADIARRTGREAPAQWADAALELREQVLDRGIDPDTRSFRQHYGNTAVDASLLLIPLMGFLPPSDPRVQATVRRIEDELGLDGHIHRFDPEQTPGSEGALPIGQHEGAFVPCTLWLASVHAMAGDVERAEEALARVRVTSPLGLLAEEVDAATGSFLGNTPLLFSHAEFLRARHLIERARRGEEGR